MSGLQNFSNTPYNGGHASPSTAMTPRSPLNGNGTAVYDDPHTHHDEMQIRRRQEAHEEDLSNIEVHAAKTTAAIESIAALQRELEEHMTNLLDKVQHRLDEVESTIDLVDRTEAELLERRTSLRAETEAHFDDLIHQMLSRKEQLLRDIDDITGKKQVYLASHRSDLDQVRQHLKTGQEFVHSSSVDALNQKPEILHKLEELRSYPCHLELREDCRLDILAERETMQRAIATYGIVSGINAVAIHSICKGAGIGDRESDALNSSQLVNGMPTHFVVQVLDTHGNAHEEGGDNVTFEMELLSTFDGIGAYNTNTDGFVSNADITDHHDGSYTCSYTPQVEGDVNLHVRINGLPVKNSPFSLRILPANRSVVFRDLSNQLNHGARLEHGNALARQNLQVKTHRVALSKEPLPSDRPSWFKFKINLLHGSATGRSANNGWVFLGLTSSLQPKESSHRDGSSYGWAGHCQVWESGVDHTGEQGWKGFVAGDSPVFMYDPIGGHLAMCNHTNLYTMTVGPAPRSGYFVHANLLGAGDAVELIAPTESDRSFLQENLKVIRNAGGGGATQRSTTRTLRRSGGSNGSLDGSDYGSANGSVSQSPGALGASVVTSPLGASPSAQRQNFRESGRGVGASPRSNGSPTKRTARNVLRPKTQPGGF